MKKFNLDKKTLILIIAVVLFAISALISEIQTHAPPTEFLFCDVEYGVQYFKYRNRLSVRFNSEGKPVECNQQTD